MVEKIECLCTYTGGEYKYIGGCPMHRIGSSTHCICTTDSLGLKYTNGCGFHSGEAAKEHNNEFVERLLDKIATLKNRIEELEGRG